MRNRTALGLVVIVVMALVFAGSVSAAAAPASIGSAVATPTHTMKACKAAKKHAAKLNKRFKKMMSSRTTSLQQVMNASKRHNDARNRAASICSRVVVPEPKPNTFSGDPRDPRPKDWVRPADGSGLPGSVFEKVLIAPNCPVTISRIEMAEIIAASGDLLWVATMFGENYSPLKVRVHFTADVINGRDGRNWNANPARGWVGQPRVIDRERELNPWQEWEFSHVALRSGTASPGDLEGVLLGATLTCLD